MARQPARKSVSQQVVEPAVLASRPHEQVKSFKRTSLQDLFWDMLTFDRLMTGPVIHLIYWAGLALIVLGGFATVGGAVGVAMREEWPMGPVLAVPVVVAGFLVLACGALLWRSFCEFYVAIFRISDDLKAMRAAMETGQPIAPAPRGRRAEGSDGGL